jgi:ankyrin repeat protein
LLIFWNALHFAALNGHEDVVRFLLEIGIDPHCQTRHRESPLMFASFMGFPRIVELLLESEPNFANLERDPLCWAAKGGHLDIIKTLVAAGSDPNGLPQEKETPAMVACRYGFEEVVQYLIGLGVDFTRKDMVRFVPMMEFFLWLDDRV